MDVAIEENFAEADQELVSAFSDLTSIDFTAGLCALVKGASGDTLIPIEMRDGRPKKKDHGSDYACGDIRFVKG